MKHGPIALIDDRVPIVVLAPRDALFEKTLSNVQEVLARGGKVVAISDPEGLARLEGQLTYAMEVPYCDPFVTPLLYAIPAQLLAYHGRGGEGHRCRSAAQPRQERDGRVWARPCF